YVLKNNRHQITAILTNVNSITDNLKQSNAQITSIVNNLNTTSSNLAKVDIKPIIDKANSSLESVNLILDEIYNGNGTITKLMRDSLLYDNINEMILEATRLVENIKEHPNRYIQFSVFGSKDKGAKLDSGDEKRLKEFAKDSLRTWYP